MNHRDEIPARVPRVHRNEPPSPESHPAATVSVRYLRNVLKPRQLLGVEGEIRKLEYHFAKQLIDDGYATWQTSQ